MALSPPPQQISFPNPTTDLNPLIGNFRSGARINYYETEWLNDVGFLYYVFCFFFVCAGKNTLAPEAKNDIWYRFNEGYSNALKKPIKIANLK